MNEIVGSSTMTEMTLVGLLMLFASTPDTFGMIPKFTRNLQPESLTSLLSSWKICLTMVFKSD